MSLLLEAFPCGRPTLRASVPLAVLVTVLAMVAVLVPPADPAEAATAPSSAHVVTKKPRKPEPPRASSPKPSKPKPAKPKPKPAKPTSLVGKPPRNYVVPGGSYFSYPNRGKRERQAIRRRVLFTIQGVWGGRRSSQGIPLPGNGTIRIATWSFDDWAVARALVAAHRRGASVQVIAAKGRNNDHPAWRWLRKKLGKRLYRPGSSRTAPMHSFARVCGGSCRGPGGTPHSKYMLFDNVGAGHARHVTVQTSMNLTAMAFYGQWNQAQVMHSKRVYDDFHTIFRESSLARRLANPYHAKAFGPVTNYFFPRPWAWPSQDPVMQNLNAVACTGATAGGTGRTTIRVIQYAIYGSRGVWIAKKLRALWEAGCDVAIIYSVSSRPVLKVLRSKSGRGAIPMRQSVERDRWGNIVKYNHSKWMTIVGHWARSPASYVSLSGSANWANMAFAGDEQMQRVQSRPEALKYLGAFAKTWQQESSNRPRFGRVLPFGRTVAPFLDPMVDPHLAAAPAGEPVFGRGVYRFLTED